MKSRKITYVLVVVVLLLWAWIAKKIFFSGEQEHVYARPEMVACVVKNTDTLSLDYRDPFLGEAGVVVVEARAVRKTGVRLLSKTNKAIPEIKISYIGRIGCRAGELYIVDIEGRRVSLVKGESIGDVTLTAVKEDELVFTCGGNEYRIAVTH